MRDFKFTWGDTVRVVESPPREYQPGQYAAVCGLREVKDEQEAAAAGFPLGCLLYTVEFDDGSSVEVPEQFLVAHQ